MHKAKMTSRSAQITLDGSVESVFPLFGPLKEKEWAFGWELRMIFLDMDEMQAHTVFITDGHPPHEDHYTWIVSQYEPLNHFFEYTVFTSERVWFITIKCVAGEIHRRTYADITYTYIGLSELGVSLNEQSLSHIFSHELKDWEKAINHYLQTGKRLTHH
jgi:hypothetical protein